MQSLRSPYLNLAATHDVSRKLSDVVVLKCLLQYSCYQGTGTFLHTNEMDFRKDSRNESL